ncbi:MAG: acyl-phosphate glycerol 3-phosphate acyltransferase [Pelagibacteraceae bacterium BACL5 MAG-120705-bin12]|jgi:acyl phosphate:glycerol-3-phosphate acyltransferase|uniref:glycerol-3-phosphate 1-O-acyltransferase PlsY n=1 Tax=Candidatus Pelagibacter sp. TaxID=2024849 RepID=UPI00071627CB|nr:MAG: acyl-phosphate glycerol 3-phosphate acyltransferase [Pelagibacteraceae bacterium BACL5 MAG-121128-bin54]KRO61705.1 MAG: acyl-phosphate glycerol 3-phosphate acyltransferase [Pelagibacteraceae bacterium BACL5 MAG-120705-bin12]KRO65097.1 MAG: acyl-phosphate glycerol 3-phosphate acyltransferase [Pelagibacteraceae bacterium BACL5 MAG-120820-bin39]MDA1166819.1 glycerol-3-phosphate 1-O-acyltransferase PlsY [Pseudomonadota bacterium]
MEFFLVSFVSYLMGSIPFGFILTKLFLKQDIRNIGSGNIGATNALRTGNKFLGYSTLILDIAKAIIPILYVKNNYPDLIYLASLSAFLGHVFPIWLKFKGGKGVATYLGILFSINFIYGFIFVSNWLIIFFLSKYSSLSSLIASFSIPVYLYISGNTNGLSFFLIMFVLIFYTHRENVKRLKNQEETKTKIY